MCMHEQIEPGTVWQMNSDYELEEENTMQQELIRYPKDTNGQRVGCFYAVVVNTAHEDDGPTVAIGWSAYNWECEDRPFLKTLARDIARGRAMAGQTKGRMPDELKKHLTNFLYQVNDFLRPARVYIVNDDRERWNGN